ncbi:hypothetical protein LVY72_07325 [Arthrobacter sp. I2-34]|uniref:Uncharacterized protein n=1 Tax=Arthrobacter hankyongi TaxID=2904801 RepID=A0ABS9L5H6_9MICC|nr:hypothetical protein [Arthrobacter hankyongi]MCG2621727.1 hypothetical protein [Arthrobacter hankyongi]
METNGNSSDDIRLHTEDPAEGDDPSPGPDIRAHSQDSAEGPDDIAAAQPARTAAPVPVQDVQPETD